MSRRRFLAGLLVLGAMGGTVAAQEPKPEENQQGELPPEEDKSRLPKEYSFNPVQSNKEVTVGEFYFKKGDYNAAAARFDEAVKWNPGNAQAWLRLAEASEKNHALKAARVAYLKYVETAPEAKNVGEIRKRIGNLKD